MSDLTRKRRAWRPLLVCALFFGLAGFFEAALQPVGIAQGYLVGGKSREAAVAQAAGEFRIVAANLLWDRVVDHYHHQYMAQGGDWEKNRSLLPLLHTIITLDPHFVEAYQLMGGTILPRTGHPVQGQAVLAEGIKNNPYDWELYREMALLYASTEHRPQDALPYARAGLAQANDEFSRRLMRRLCDTLQERARDKQTPHSTVSGQPTHPPQGPALAATTLKAPPSVSG